MAITAQVLLDVPLVLGICAAGVRRSGDCCELAVKCDVCLCGGVVHIVPWVRMASQSKIVAVTQAVAG